MIKHTLVVPWNLCADFHIRYANGIWSFIIVVSVLAALTVRAPPMGMLVELSGEVNSATVNSDVTVVAVAAVLVAALALLMLMLILVVSMPVAMVVSIRLAAAMAVLADSSAKYHDGGRARVREGCYETGSIACGHFKGASGCWTNINPLGAILPRVTFGSRVNLGCLTDGRPTVVKRIFAGIGVKK
jgi:hypothetical protein